MNITKMSVLLYECENIMTVLDDKSTLDFAELFLDESKALAFAYEYDLLFDGGVCDATKGCQGNYIISKDVSAKTGYRLMCSHCRKKRSIFYNSIFTRAKIEVRQVLHLIYCWANECSCDFTAHECRVSVACVTNFFEHLGKLRRRTEC